VKDERTASTKERSCSSTNLIDEEEILVVIPTKLLVALWLERKKRGQQERARRERGKKQETKAQNKQREARFFFCF
jgi:hypothetical protein